MTAGLSALIKYQRTFYASAQLQNLQRTHYEYVFTVSVPLSILMSRANMDSPTGRSSPLYKCYPGGIVGPSAVLSCR